MNPDELQPRVALALAGGGARGLAHVGVIRALEELEIPIDLVCGTSMGAVVGGLWSMGWSVEEVDSLMLTLDWSDYFRDAPNHHHLTGNARFLDAPEMVTLRWQGNRFRPPSSLVKGQKVELLLDDLTRGYHGHQDFLHLPRSFACVATDIESGEAIYLLHGEISTALRASLSLPSVFEPVRYMGRVLVDGGLVENLPTGLAKTLHAQHIIAVNIPVELKAYDDLGNLLAVADQSRQIIALPQEWRSAEAADILIVLDVASIGVLEFSKTNELVRLGYEATMAMSDELLKLKLALEAEDSGSNYSLPRTCVRLPKTMWLAELKVEGSSSLNLQQAESVLGVRLGDSFHPASISTQVKAFVAGGIASRAGYQVLPLEDLGLHAESGLQAARLILQVEEQPQVDLDLFASYNEVNRGIFGFRVNWPELRGPGSFMRLSGRLSGVTKVSLDYWESTFKNRGLYLHPRVFYADERVYLHNTDGDRIVRYKARTWGASFGTGLVLRRGARLELGLAIDHARSTPDIADTSWHHEEKSFANGYLKFEIDTRNALDFPTRGLTMVADYKQFVNWPDEQDAFRRWEFRTDLYHAFPHLLGGGTRGQHSGGEGSLKYQQGLVVVESGFAAGGTPNEALPSHKLFAWGGWPTMPGRALAERWVDSYATAWIGSRAWVNGTVSIMPLAAWGWTEGDFLMEGDRHSHDFGWGVEIAVRTFLGPLRVRLATLDGHEPDLYLRLGWE